MLRWLRNRLVTIQFATNGYFTPLTTICVAINTLIFLPCFFTAYTRTPVVPWLWLDRQSLLDGQIWRLVSAGFTHVEILHYLLNMLFFVVFARHPEERLGTRGLSVLILTTIVLSGLMNCALWTSPYIGFSGVTYAVFVAFATMHPRLPLLFGIPAWVWAAVYVAIDLLSAIQPGNRGNIAYVVHLTGAALGFLVIRCQGRVQGWWRRWSRQHRERVLVRQEEQETASQEHLDRLLEKVGREGLAALSRSERAFLQRRSEEERRRHGL